MKKSYKRVIVSLWAAILAVCQVSFSQNATNNISKINANNQSVKTNSVSSSSTNWLRNPNDRENSAFVENAGQLINVEGIDSKVVKYSFEDCSMNVYFTDHSVIYKIVKNEEVSEREWEKYQKKNNIIGLREEEENEHKQITIPKTEIVEMNWEGSTNASLKVKGEDETSFYFNYYMPVIDKDKVIGNVKGFRKLVYENVYPNIDIEYTIHPEQGIEYAYILHPGADVSSIKMNYSKDATLKKDFKNNIIISTSIGNITDHAPLTYIGNEQTKKNIYSKFDLLNSNTVGFKLENNNSIITETTVIDPWQVGPSYPANGYTPNDIAVDGAGNVLTYSIKQPGLFGTTTTQRINKYSATGTLVWAFNATTVAGYNADQGDIAADPTGNIYASVGLGGGNPTFYNTIKINSAGTALIWGSASPGTGTNDMYETWTITFNCNYTNFYQSGGGRVIAGTTYFNMSVEEPVNATTGAEGAIVENDTLGEIYCTYYAPNALVYHMTADPNVTPNLAGALQIPTTGNLNRLVCFNPASGARLFNVATGYSYTDGDAKAPSSIGMNAMASSCLYLYTMSGNKLDRWNPTTGAHYNQITITGGVASVNQYNTGTYTEVNSGLLTDKCGNVYVGSNQKIYEYDPTLATLLNTFTVPGKVFDMAWTNSSNTDIVVCGGTTNATTFLADVAIPPCTLPNQVTIVPTQPTCTTPGSATATATFCGAPYTYLWSDGQTTATATNLSPGTYTVTVSSSVSCPYSYVETQTVTINPAAAGGTPATTGPSQTTCLNTATLSGNTPTVGTGTWTLVSGIGTITTPSSSSSTVTGLGTGVNVFQWTISNPPCTPSSSNDTIIVSPPVTPSVAGPNQSICGTSATLSGNAPLVGTGLWTLVSGTGTITTSASPSSTVTGLGTGANVFQWTITSGSCPPSSSQVTITAGATIVSNAGPNQSVCGASATLAGNTAGTGTGTWTLLSGAATITNPSLNNSTVTGLGSGANVFQWTLTAPPCPPATSQVTITSTPVPTVANAGPPQTVCGTTATLAGNIAAIGTGTWTLVSGTGTIISPNSPTSGVTGLGTGANVFQWEIDNLPCPATTSQVTITSVPAPTVANAGTNQTLCSNTATMAANAAIIGTGVWTLVSGSGTITTPSSEVTTITGLGVGANVFQWTISNAPCPPSSSQVTITQVAPPTVSNAGPNQTICSTTATLAGNNPTIGTGTWTLISGTGTIVSPNLPGTGITGLGVGVSVFQWEIDNPPCPPSTSQVTITNGTPSTVSTAGPNQTICSNTATMAADSAIVGTGVWTVISGSGTITNSASPTTTITGLGVGANVFQWEIDNLPCPPSTSQVTITQVAPPTVAAAGPNQSICVNSATLAGNTPIIGTGVWTLISGTGTITNPTSPNSTVTGLTVGNNVFQWEIDNVPCPPTTSQVTITVNPLPVIIVNSPTICAGQTANLTANGGTTYTWSAGATSTGIATATASPAATATYTVTGTSLGCPNTAVATVTVNPLPTATVSGGGNGCVGSVFPSVSIALTGNGPWNLTYSNGTNSTSVSTSTSPYVITNPGVGTYTVTSISNANCIGTSSGSATVTSNPIPVAAFVSPASACIPLCVTFTDASTVSAGSIISWNWHFSDGGTSTQQNPNHCFTSPGTYSVSLTVTSSNGCVDSVHINNAITAYQKPNASFSCPPYQSIADPNIQFTNYSTGATSWLWNFGDGYSLPSNNTSAIQSPQHLYSQLGDYCISLSVSNGHCTDTTQVCLVIQPEFIFYIPNAFSPNGDGTNDYFFGKGEGINTYEMWIFDRWGNQIFHGGGLDAKWDGTMAGRIVQEDVYVYLVKLTDWQNEEHKYLGTVTVVK